MADAGLIGPNALTQLVPLLERVGGRRLRDELLAKAGIFHMPDMTGLIAEAPVARLHQAMRAELPDLAPSIAWEAGERTADYIIANRIPNGVRLALHHLPTPFAGRLLAQAISRNAWTFAGSGHFSASVARPISFEIEDNPVVRGEYSTDPLCAWHTAVFERLYRSLVSDRYRARETACCATGASACRFELSRRD